MEEQEELCVKPNAPYWLKAEKVLERLSSETMQLNHLHVTVAKNSGVIRKIQLDVSFAGTPYTGTSSTMTDSFEIAVAQAVKNCHLLTTHAMAEGTMVKNENITGPSQSDEDRAFDIITALTDVVANVAIALGFDPETMLNGRDMREVKAEMVEAAKSGRAAQDKWANLEKDLASLNVTKPNG